MTSAAMGSTKVPLPMTARVSVVIPCRNEREFIGRCLQSILDNEPAGLQLEVLVVDGMSDDGTREIIQEIQQLHSNILLVDNPRRVTPVAINLGIRYSSGDAVLLLGAHAEVTAHYVAHLVGWLDRSGADAVGGVMTTVPANESPMAKAIAAGLSDPMGVGNSHYRIGVSGPRWVDTVVFGCYRRDVFDRIGVFDEELVRNQDDEFNMRLSRHGGRMLLVPDVESRYYARASLGKLCRMYLQYGYFKPLVVRKVRGVMTGRQLVPASFVATIVLLTVAAIVDRRWGWGLLGLLAAYGVAIGAACVRIGREQGWATGLAALAVFPALHFSYGLGYLRGLLEFFVFRRAGVDRPNALPMSR